ncbi:MAG: DUF4249 family protein [Paludibacter sp.]|nr:DUF4249 family protein [Paludibacter sp.]
MSCTLLKFITLLIFFSFPFFLFASSKHTISGTITDANTGESLIGTSITVKNLASTGVTTNAYGYFSLTLPEAKYTFVISYLGYETIVLPLNLNENKVFNFKLIPNSQQLSDIEIIAQRKNHNITSNEIGMEKLEVKEIAKIPVLFGEADIMKTLKLTPGIKSVGEGSGGMFVRGGNNSQNLILLDEATVYNADHLLGFFSTFNSDAIKDIQMFKGTAPAEYGGRISSVLDVKMNDGNNQDYQVGGGIGLISSRLNVEGPIAKGKSSFLVTARRTYADLFLKLSPNDLINSNQLYFYDLNVKMNYIINDKNRLYLSGYSNSTIPNAVAIDSFKVTNSIYPGGEAPIRPEIPAHFYEVSVKFTDPVAEKNYYIFILYLNGAAQNRNYIYDDRFTNGKQVESVLILYYPEMKTGDKISVEMQCIDKSVYEYFKSMGNSAMGPRNSSSPANPYTNLTGTILGYFSAHTVERREYIVP